MRRSVRESPRPVSRIRPFVESTLPCHGRPNESELDVSPEEAWRPPFPGDDHLFVAPAAFEIPIRPSPRPLEVGTSEGASALRSIRGPVVPLPETAGPALDAVERSMRSASTLHDPATPPTSRRATKTVRSSAARRTSLPDLSIRLGVRARDRSLAFAVERPFVRHGAPDDSLFIHAGGWGSSPCASRLPGGRGASGCPVAPACLREASGTDPEPLLARERRRFDGRLSSSTQSSNGGRTIRESSVDRGAVRFPSPRREGMPPPRGAFHRRFAIRPHLSMSADCEGCPDEWVIESLAARR